MRLTLSVILLVLFSSVARASCIGLEGFGACGPLAERPEHGPADGGVGRHAFILPDGPVTAMGAGNFQGAALETVRAPDGPALPYEGMPPDAEALITAASFPDRQDIPDAGWENGLLKHIGVPLPDRVVKVDPLALEFQDIHPFAPRAGGPGIPDRPSVMAYNLRIGGIDGDFSGTSSVPEPSTLLLFGACLLGLRGIYNRIMA